MPRYGMSPSCLDWCGSRPVFGAAIASVIFAFGSKPVGIGTVDPAAAADVLAVVLATVVVTPASVVAALDAGAAAVVVVSAAAAAVAGAAALLSLEHPTIRAIDETIAIAAKVWRELRFIE